MAEDKCGQCGAAAEGMICGFCGSLTADAQDVEAQRAALEEFHRVLQDHPRERQIKMLRSGYLPQYGELLIDAGVRCLSLIVDEDISAEPTLSARERLGAIVTRLKLEPPSVRTRTSIRVCEERSEKHRRSNMWNSVLGLTAVALVVGGLVVWWLL